MDEYSKFIAASRYARWLDDKGRRETWEETVDRYVGFWPQLSTKEAEEVTAAVVNLEVMPSMRAIMTAGKALERDNVAGFNCSYLPIDNIRAFDELMYILLCGTGVGFSVERQYVGALPEVPEALYAAGLDIVVADSKVGWATAFKQLIAALYSGDIPTWNVDKVRPSGARLKTFGGRASGPQPLVDLFRYTVEVFTAAQGRRLTSLECHDICCKIAEVIVVGGVRRSALISLSNPSDGRMREAKSGQWWLDQGQRALSNNSACYTEKPEFSFFMDEMRALHTSKSGERGVFSRKAAQNIAARNGRREPAEFGTNPCSEIILRPNQFCNLSEVVVRAEDTLDTLKRKVRLATILGTLQATLTNFRYLRPIWKRNTEEEALLGVSLTGIMDSDMMCDVGSLKETLGVLKEVAIETNKVWAKRLGINASTAITCVKPSGTVSQLVNSASGIHPRFSEYYIRTVRADRNDPMAQYMADAGFPSEVDVTKDSTLVFSFPVRSPMGSVCATEIGALGQLELWKVYAEHWCEHKPSITVYYSDDEFFSVCAWMWRNFDILSGIALLPRSDHSYAQAPYQAISEKEYKALAKALPKFDWEALATFESEDTTTGSQELACVGTSCEFTGV
jgi:ribonucleoside-diphosphate reductase alpha chain